MNLSLTRVSIPLQGIQGNFWCRPNAPKRDQLNRLFVSTINAFTPAVNLECDLKVEVTSKISDIMEADILSMAQ